MAADIMKNFDAPIPAMLQAGIQVMIYVGLEDFICNWVGNQQWVEQLPWYGHRQWSDPNITRELPWTVDGKTAGTAKSLGPLSLVKVADAGHMVSLGLLSAAPS